MLGKMLKKELKLCMHPTTPVMMLLCIMVLIPNYPYTVAFFYLTLAVFFTCLQGRENNDVFYSMTLPVSRGDIVRARMVFVVLQEILQTLLILGVCILKQCLKMPENAGGIEANLALIGAGLFLFGLFNIVYFPAYYRNVDKVGVPFVRASILFFALVVIGEVAVNAVPFVRDVLDTQGLCSAPKAICCAVGAAAYAAMTFAAYRASLKGFEKQDL